jgi:ATP-dependent exoDNAse (exonuclease V) alpha subunit
MNPDQQAVFDTVIKDKSNVLITGGAGVGKSYLIKQIVQHCESKKIIHGVTATTGSAAFLIDGMTVHSFFGIKLKLGKTIDKNIKRLYRNNKKHYDKLTKLKLLIIDEISMMNHELFEYLNEYLQVIKKNDHLFGGVQIVLCGDMHQLPPCDGLTFQESPIWLEHDWITCELTKSIRQENDNDFAQMLNRIRIGIFNKDDIKALRKPRKLKNATVLFSTNKKVDDYNNLKINNILQKGAKSRIYKATRSNEQVLLCSGLKVMLTTNIDVSQGLCNGAIGKVIDIFETEVSVEFTNKKKVIIPYVDVYNDDDIVINSIMPLRAAYAITINKCQGMTLGAVVLSMEDFDAFKDVRGRFYTAISRVRALDDLVIVGDVKARHVMQKIEFKNKSSI